MPAMPNANHQSITNRLGAALGSLTKHLSRLAPGACASSALAAPIHSELAVASPLAGDPLMANVLAGMGIVAGIVLGIVYRSMSESREVLRKQATTADAELRAVLTMTDDAVLLLDSRATIRGANPAAEELFGRPIEELVGEELAKLITHPLNLPELTRSGPAAFKSTKLHGEFKDHVDIVLSEVHLTKGTSFLALIRDGSAVENAKQSSCEKSASYPDLSAPVSKFSHDLNNVLTGIIGNLSLILMTAPPDPATSERITGAKRSAIKAQELNRKLLALAKGEDAGDDKQIAATPETSTIVPMPSMMTTEIKPTLPKPAVHVPVKQQPVTGIHRVLVLDDEEAICALVASALGSMGYEVTEAYDAEQAIKACEEAVASGSKYELIISDLSLPGNITGEEAVRRIKKLDPEIKAIVSSGYDSDPVMSRFRDHGFCAAISKPYDISKLGRVVTNALKAEEEQRRTA
jgi:CheY-like chemotaxis protein